MTRHALAGLLAGIMALAGCAGASVDGGPAMPTADECARACEHAGALGCEWDSPGADDVLGTADDIACAIVCLDAANSGSGFAWDLNCVVQSSNCAAANSCW